MHILLECDDDDLRDIDPTPEDIEGLFTIDCQWMLETVGAEATRAALEAVIANMAREAN